MIKEEPPLQVLRKVRGYEESDRRKSENAVRAQM
jgi:hypothetical protein